MTDNFTPIPMKWLSSDDVDPLALLVVSYVNRHTYTGTAVCRTVIRWVVEWLGYKPNSNPGKINQRVAGILNFLQDERVIELSRPLEGIRKCDDFFITLPPDSLLNGNPTALGQFAQLFNGVQDAIVSERTDCDKGGMALVAAYLAVQMAMHRTWWAWPSQKKMAHDLRLDPNTLRSWLAGLERLKVLWQRRVVTVGSHGAAVPHNIYAFDPAQLDAAEASFRKWSVS